MRSMATAPSTATISAAHTGQTPSRRPAPTPAKARWPIPSPRSDMRFCTRKPPMRGAHAPTTTPAARASCMYWRSKGQGTTVLLEALEPEGEVLAVDAEADARVGEGVGGAVEEDLSLEDDDPVEVVGHRPQLVGDEEHGRPVVVDQVGERVAEAALGVGVDAGHGLVEHEQLGLA